MTEEELNDAEKYAKYAIKYKDEYPTLAKTLYDLSTDEMRHMSLLHDETVRLIEEYRREKGEPPVEMLAVYEYLHERQIEKANAVRGYQAQYREA